MATTLSERYFAVYTIAKRSYLEGCLRTDGAGVIHERRLWTAAEERLKLVRQAKSRLPLLLNDAADTNGVEWLAIVEDINLQANGWTSVRFSSLQVLKSRIPFENLIQQYGKPLDVAHVRPYVLCTASGFPHWIWLRRAAPAKRSEPLADGAKGAFVDIDEDPKCLGISDTTRRALVNARIGQGGFRKRMLTLWEGRCALTGSAVEQVLVASHAMAWADSDNKQRLDKFNGLLLAASVDRLFDKGLISFADDGTLLHKPSLRESELRRLGLEPGQALRTIHPKNLPYLRAHRARFGFKP